MNQKLTAIVLHSELKAFHSRWILQVKRMRGKASVSCLQVRPSVSELAWSCGMAHD